MHARMTRSPALDFQKVIPHTGFSQQRKRQAMKKLIGWFKYSLNPFIWIINQFNYDCHVQSQFRCKVYEPYDFTQDLKYFPRSTGQTHK